MNTANKTTTTVASASPAVLVLHPNLHAHGRGQSFGVNPSYIASCVQAQRVKWAAEGVDHDSLDDLCAEMKAHMEAGHATAFAVRKLLPKVLEAQASVLFNAHAERLCRQFAVSRQTARALITEARKHFHGNARPGFERAIAPVYARVKAASHEAFLTRRAMKAPLATSFATKLVEAGIVE